ncbi:DUF885 domain-containing protein [Sphingomonas abietis]|uniref:DUF885 family protein n=1 Tax=Sphingomonas abietis TaxID=3012344 RepID=A0ABY7NMR1_9SPHN|nr:DUF885 family protein [Sphingomonas abietis]WBO20796.1 DUF885 family protein [Sphingomonas abietis]
MTAQLRVSLMMGLLMAGTVPILPVATAAEAATVSSSAAARFKAIASAEYSWRQTMQAPDEDSPKGTPLHLPDVGPKAQAEKLARWTQVSQQLAAIPQSQLSTEDRVNFAVYQGQIDALLASQRYRDYEKPFNADSSFWGDIAEWPRGVFKTEEDYRSYIAMLREIPRYYDEQIVNMRAGLARGFTAPQITLVGRDVGLAAVADTKSPEDSAFYAPFKTRPATISAADQADLRRQALQAIGDAVVPAHAKLLHFMRDEYFPKARTSIDAYALPDGKAYYRSKIREFVTEDKSPEEIHQLGVAEVARIRGQMLDVMKQVGFQGDLPAFLTFLRTDPRFYAKTPQDLLDRAAWIAKTFDGKASEWFGHLPRSRFAIKPVPADLAPFYTGGRGGPGIYLVNTYNLPSRPLYSLTALTLHESAPGHAFQMPLAAENKDLPDFRRSEYLSAYGEGWAVYCEALGEDMGMYDTPYDRFGMLSYQMWRAARLVVDTGIHTEGWTRQQAQQYLHDNTAMADHEIETEVDRYIAWPGQALSYYMGEQAILNARHRAEKALGPKFNIRAFHDAVLSLGSVPLPVIDARIDQLIADGGKGPYPDEE